jgi:deazaflavin-dependent oxidoreductase (nitroreductase family)
MCSVTVGWQFTAEGTTIDTPTNWTETQHARRGVTGLIRRIVRSISHRDSARPVRRMLVAYDRVLYKLTRGRLSSAGFSRFPSLMLILRRPNGETVRIPLQYLPIDGDAYIVGTNWCRPKHPLWSAWLLRNPSCRVNIKGRESSRRAVLLEGADHAAIWPKIVHKSPYYDECERRTGRQPRVFRLDAIDDVGP